MNRECPHRNHKFIWMDGSEYKVLNIVYNVEDKDPMITFVKSDDNELSNKIWCISLMRWFDIVDNLDKFNNMSVCIYE